MATWTELYPGHLQHLQREYDRVLREAGWDGVVLHSGTAVRKSMYDDQFWPLRATPHFQHWVPLAQADCALLIVPGAVPRLFVNVAVDFWEGRAQPENDHFWSSFDVVEVNGAEAIKDLLPAGKKLAVIAEDAARAASWGFGDDRRNPDDLHHRLDLVRSRKTPYEHAAIAEANRRAAAGHAAVMAAFRDGDRSELQLHLLYLEATAQDDPETPYKNIVALGEHAATLHHVTYGREPERGPQSLLVDAGATCLGYHSDITRTAVKGSGAGADAFGHLLAQMEALQQEMCRRVTTGTPYERLHNECHELLAGVLREVGVARAPADELVASGATRAFLPHGLGHSLGLQTHDVGCALVKPQPQNPFLRNTADIAVGQVFTIEPGVYFIAPLLDKLRAEPVAAHLDWSLIGELSRFGGIRIEDDVAVVDGGIDNMTRTHLPQ